MAAVAAEKRPLLYFCGFAGRFCRNSSGSSVYNPIANDRRAALRSAAVAALFAAMIAIAFLVYGPREAFAAGIGGGAIALGQAVAAIVALGGVVTARIAFMRLLVGTTLKWLIALGICGVSMRLYHLPPLPMVVGLAAALLGYLVALNIRFVTSSHRQSKG
jgi:hypothetical protein